ncbi:uncharacterized protein IL334_000080 [Kwoniella shivajii]|uniref:Diphthamide biosynthesis protein 4 n=1 Tax=Kwoniella shivajii TaxID=564305 RepID=A0ABZ1CSC6_9TREE|nr:hypothetical protein IL334_000080 [Kwoniella shivajii]
MGVTNNGSKIWVRVAKNRHPHPHPHPHPPTHTHTGNRNEKGVIAKISNKPITDYYAILGLNHSATCEDVNRSWKRLALIYHPDKNPANPGPPSSASTSVSASTSTFDGSSQNLVKSNSNGDVNVHVDIRSINEARTILLDPTKREEWLIHYNSNYNSTNGHDIPIQDGPHVFRHISLDDFTPHHLSSEQSEEADLTSEGPVIPNEGLGNIDKDQEREPDYFTHPCRCGGTFRITLQQLEEDVDVIGCEGCGEWIRVGYEVIDEDEEEGEGE